MGNVGSTFEDFFVGMADDSKDDLNDVTYYFRILILIFGAIVFIYIVYRVLTFLNKERRRQQIPNNQNQNKG